MHPNCRKWQVWFEIKWWISVAWSCVRKSWRCNGSLLLLEKEDEWDLKFLTSFLLHLDSLHGIVQSWAFLLKYLVRMLCQMNFLIFSNTSKDQEHWNEEDSQATRWDESTLFSQTAIYLCRVFLSFGFLSTCVGCDDMCSLLDRKLICSRYKIGLCGISAYLWNKTYFVPIEDLLYQLQILSVHIGHV